MTLGPSPSGLRNLRCLPLDLWGNRRWVHPPAGLLSWSTTQRWALRCQRVSSGWAAWGNRRWAGLLRQVPARLETYNPASPRPRLLSPPLPHQMRCLSSLRLLTCKVRLQPWPWLHRPCQVVQPFRKAPANRPATSPSATTRRHWRRLSATSGRLRSSSPPSAVSRPRRNGLAGHSMSSTSADAPASLLRQTAWRRVRELTKTSRRLKRPSSASQERVGRSCPFLRIRVLPLTTTSAHDMSSKSVRFLPAWALPTSRPRKPLQSHQKSWRLARKPMVSPRARGVSLDVRSVARFRWRPGTATRNYWSALRGTRPWSGSVSAPRQTRSSPRRLAWTRKRGSYSMTSPRSAHDRQGRSLARLLLTALRITLRRVAESSTPRPSGHSSTRSSPSSSGSGMHSMVLASEPQRTSSRGW